MSMERVHRRLRRDARQILGISAAFTLAVLGAWHLGWLGIHEAENTSYDRALRTFTGGGAVSEKVVVLAFDDLSLKRIAENAEDRATFGRWPYSRSIYAHLFEQLHADGARAVVLDLVMDTPNDDGGDEAMAEVIRALQLPVYLGFAIHPDQPPLPPVDARNLFPHEVLEAQGADLALAALAEDAGLEVLLAVGTEDAPAVSAQWQAERLAFPVRGQLRPLHERQPLVPITALLEVTSGAGLVEPEEDRDGVLRRTHFAQSDGHNAYATLPVAVAADLYGARQVELSGGQLRLGDRVLRVNADGSAAIDYRGSLHQRFHVYSAAALLHDYRERENPDWKRNIPEAAFRDKVVFVAGTALGTADVKATPFSSWSPGVVKQAAVLDGLLGGGFIVRAPSWLLALCCFLLTLLLVCAVTAFRSTLVDVAIPIVLYAGAFAITGVALALWQLHLPATPLVWAGIGGSVTATAVARLFADRKRAHLKESFGRYLDRTLVEQMAESSELPKLEGENRELTAFFSDIRGFSTFSEALKDDPQKLVRILNTYLTRVSAVLMREGGCIDKYIGDAVVCLFGAPLRQEDHALRACRAALGVQQEVGRLREEFRAQGLPDVYTRIGLNSDLMFVGNFGSEQLFDYTAMGDGMNLAARLEGANKAYASAIMIGPQTYAAAKDHIEARELDRVRVAGKKEAVTVYELLCLKGELPPAKRETVDLYALALSQYRAAAFGDALTTLARIEAKDPQDGPTRTLKKRCQSHLTLPPEGFDGVVNLDK
jgi:adenylate cyclase